MKNKALIFLLAAALVAGCRLRTSKDKDDDSDQDDTATTAPVGKVIPSAVSGTYTADYKSSVRTAQLNLDAGAAVFNLSEATDKLFNAVTKNDPRKFTLSHEGSDTLETLYFKMQGHRNHMDLKDESIDMSLNTAPVWDISAETAASQSTFDLTKFKVRSLKIEMNAGEFDVKLQPVLANTNVDVHMNIGKAKISIPKDTACELDIDATLGDSEFPGFTKKSDGHYETPNFAAAKNKIHIKAKYSLAEFKVLQY